MGILYRLVFLTACPGTHHKLAMDALRHLRCPDAEGWRDLFLNYYEPYLRGAKVPDNEFKDFQNHVLHVRDNYWGGAIRTSQLWYERLVMALRREYWSDAVYTAGILSHYFTDPMMPFHTGQTEEEGKVHRAAEWSISKCYEEFQNILEQDLGGYPSIAVPEGHDWLARLIKQGAELANSHYETLIEHYDLAKGVQDPPEGLDQECKDRIAQMIGFASVGFARVLERAFIEAGSCPPMCELVVETVLATMKTPVRWLLQRMDDEDERDQLEELLDEAERTGKVIENLPDDDKFVRKLHAHQVLKVPLRELDAQPARPTGLKHGLGTPPRDREQGLLAGLFGWEFHPFDWLVDDDKPTFVPPIPIGKGGVGLGTSVVRPGGSTVRRSGSVAGSASLRRGRRPGARNRIREREQALAATEMKAGRLGSDDASGAHAEPSGDAIETSRREEPAPVRSSPAERREPRPPKRRPRPPEPPRNAPPRDDVRRDAEDESPDDDAQAASEDAAGNGESPEEKGPTRRARVGNALRGVASRVWSGASATASKVKRFVPRFKRSKSTDETAGRGEERDAGATQQLRDAEGDDGGAGERGARAASLRFHLQPASDVVDAPSIGPKMARRLETLGVTTVDDLLQADAEQIAARLGVKQITGETVRQWQQQAELMCRIPQIRGHDVQILVACGVTVPEELAGMDPASLYELIEPFLGTREAEALLRGSSPPDLNEIADWIDWAQHAKPSRAA